MHQILMTALQSATMLIVHISLALQYVCWLCIIRDLSDDEDMMRQRRYLYAQGNVLSRSFHMCSINVKNTLFRTFCTPMYIHVTCGGTIRHRAFIS